MSPSAYRERGFTRRVGSGAGKKHAELVTTIGPCIGLFHTSENRRPPEDDMAYSITKKELAPQPVLIVRRRVKRSEIAATIGEALPHIFLYAQQNGIALEGLPFTRYVEMGPGMVTMEPGMRVIGPLPSGDGEIIAATLPGGSRQPRSTPVPTINSPTPMPRWNSGWKPKGSSREVRPGSLT